MLHPYNKEDMNLVDVASKKMLKDLVDHITYYQQTHDSNMDDYSKEMLSELARIIIKWQVAHSQGCTIAILKNTYETIQKSFDEEYLGIEAQEVLDKCLWEIDRSITSIENFKYE